MCGADGYPHPRYGKASGCNGGPKSDRLNGLDGPHEQYPQPGGGNRSARIGICSIKRRGSVAMLRSPASFALFFPSAFVDIVAIFTLRAAKLGIRTAGNRSIHKDCIKLLVLA